jgi:hypothetical protein
MPFSDIHKYLLTNIYTLYLSVIIIIIKGLDINLVSGL